LLTSPHTTTSPSLHFSSSPITPVSGPSSGMGPHHQHQQMLPSGDSSSSSSSAAALGSTDVSSVALDASQQQQLYAHHVYHSLAKSAGATNWFPPTS
jgi:hypothetical protein